MYKRQVRLFWWRYMSNGNENEAEYDISRPRPRHGPK